MTNDRVCDARRAAGMVAVIVIALLSLAVPPPACRGDDPVEWRTGPDWTRQLRSNIRVTWSANPLRNALVNLARGQRVAIMLDRRVDPDQTVDIATELVPLEDFFQLLAHRLDLGVCYVGHVVYLGPRPITARLPTLLAVKTEQLRMLPDPARRRLFRSVAWQWPRLTTPRELIEQLGADAGLQIVGTDSIPHDLWDAAQLPPLNCVDRLSLVLAGFDLTFDFAADGSTATLLPISDVVVLERSYEVGGTARLRAAELSKMFPEARLRPQGQTLVVVASLEDHDAIRRLVEGKSDSIR